MRVLVADRLSEDALDEMRTFGVDVIYDPTLTADLLPVALDGVNVLIVRGTPVTESAIRGGRSLNLIIRAGAGVSNIDVASASERGIYVASCPGKNASGAAELTMRGGEPERLAAGGFARMPARHVHQFRCAESCLMYVYSDGIFDIHYVDDRGDEIPAAEALQTGG